LGEIKPFYRLHRNAKVYVKANATGFGSTFGGYPAVRQGSITTASKGNTSDGPIMDAVVFFDVNLNGLPDEGEPQTTSNGWGDYWLDIPLETYCQTKGSLRQRLTAGAITGWIFRWKPTTSTATE